MSEPVYGSSSSAGERWNINMPAVIGVVFVFVVVVVVWVVLSSDNDDGSSTSPITTAASTTTPVFTPVTPIATAASTTPASMPDASVVATTTIDPTITTAPGADVGAVPGDLAVPGRAMQRPECDEGFITVIASVVGGQASAGGIANALDAYPGSNYLLTDQTCPSLTPDVYVVFFGPFAQASDACTARSQGTEGSYVRQLSTELPPQHGVSCS